MTQQAGPSRRGGEVIVAALMALFGATATLGSLQVDAVWGADGPRPGFFPCYLGVAVAVRRAG